MHHSIQLLIHNVRSAHNVGSLFRTADAMGVAKIYLTGYTPAPVDRFGRKDARISKVSLGAEDTVPWEASKKTLELTLELIQELKNSGAEVAALEQAPQTIPLQEYVPKKDIALIVGNEVEGIEQDILKAADVVIEIPMYGSKESLNVSNAGSIALFYLSNLLRQ